MCLDAKNVALRSWSFPVEDAVREWYFYIEWLVLSIFSQQLIWRSSGGAWQSHLYCYLTLIKWVHHIAQQSPENLPDHWHSPNIWTVQVDESEKLLDVKPSFKIARLVWLGFIPGSGFDYGGTITQCQYSMRPQLDTGITESWPSQPSPPYPPAAAGQKN